MTPADPKTVNFDAELGSRPPPSANATDLVITHMILDASRDDNRDPLAMPCKKVFDTDKPLEPVALKDYEIIRIAYARGRQ